jgi:hypothetical protein
MEDVNAYCPLGADYDLTGTEVVSDGQIVVHHEYTVTLPPTFGALFSPILPGRPIPGAPPGGGRCANRHKRRLAALIGSIGSADLSGVSIGLQSPVPQRGHGC